MFRDIFLRVRSLVRRRAVEREMDDELRFHLEREIAQNQARGMSESEATRKAKQDLGGLEQVKEHARDARGVSFIETAMGDFRYGFRTLRNSPGFTAVAVISLALGVGANTAIFQLVNAIRLRTLPVSNPQELVEVHITDMSGARGSQNRQDAVTYPIWEQVRQRRQVFSGVFAWADMPFNLSPKGEVRSVSGLLVSGEFFQVLGVRPAVGRLFTEEDDYRGCGASAAVISYSFWQSEFGGRNSAIGEKLIINGQSVNVIGVTQPEFFGLDIGHQFQIAVPVCSVAPLWFNALDQGTFWWLSVMARLKPGSTPEQASAELGALSPGIFQTTLPPNYPAVSVKDYLQMKLAARSAATGLSDLRVRYSVLLWLLLAIAGAVLLNACANLANLMLARAGTREREIAVRLALGGSAGRIVQQLLVESILIAAAGAGAALLLAHWLSRGLLALLTETEAWIYVDLHWDWRVLAFTFGVAAITCFLFGLTPALRAAQTKPVDALKSGGRSVTTGRSTLGLRRGLIVSQVALSLVLLVGSLLFIRSLQNLLGAEPGFRTDGLIVVNLGFARPNPEQVKVLAWQKALLDRVGSIPGVASVADTNVVPFSGNSWSNRVWMEGDDSASAVNRKWSKISGGYFRTLGISLLAGRDFNEHDGPGSSKVAIVNEAFAKRVAKGANPVGMSFRVEMTPSTPETAYEIVGMVGNAKYSDIREDMEPLYYLPLSQDPTPQLSDQLVIRSSLLLKALLPALQGAVLETDPNARFEVYEFANLIKDSLARERLMATLSTVFAVLAALLSAVGLYGVITYIATRRRTEIGIRIALGADRGRIFGMLFRESGKMVLAGLLVGTLLTLSLATLVNKMLFGLKPYDPKALAAAIGLLLSIGLLATIAPAVRSARIPPTAALREE